MPRGTPDWHTVAPQFSMTRVLDDAELAARLGSPSLFDRGGNVIYATAFDAGLPGWSQSGGAGSPYGRPSHRAAYLGGYSARLSSGTSTTVRREATISIPLMAAAPIGVEWVQTTDFATNIAGVRLRTFVGANRTTYDLRYDYGEDDIERWDDGGSWVDVDTTLVFTAGLHEWAHFKYVIDPTARQYVSARAGSTLYDLAGAGGEQAVTGALRRIEITLHSLDDTGDNHETYFGLLVVTVNE